MAIHATKLHLPRPRASSVVRERLPALLDRGLEEAHRLILVSAPAGAGKTTLLAHWLVKLTVGLPGGIGNTGGEYGGPTAPLVLLGLRHGREKTVQGLPLVVYKGHDLLQRFVDSQGTTACREILGHARVSEASDERRNHHA